ncbi:MAG: hypothetical protein IKJ35_01945 [Clostridia bacterium]|nr:hypothetical protein [Clostridia bacterium]
MRLDSKYYSFCKEVGLMSENYSRENALKLLKEAISKEKAADPEYVKRVNALTLTSPEIRFRACILYHYNATVEYVKNNVIKDTVINDIGTIGIPDALHITEYKGKGEYKVVTDMNSVPYSYWNDKNILTFEDMKRVLANTIEDKLPAGSQSFRSKEWSVSAYLVPVLSIEMQIDKKWYYSNYNLQNGYYNWDYPDNPALLKLGKTTKTTLSLLRVLAVGLSVVGLLMALTSSKASALSYIVPVAIGALNIFIWKNTKKKGKYYDRFFLKNPNKTMVSQLIPAFFSIALGLLSLIFAVAA